MFRRRVYGLLAAHDLFVAALGVVLLCYYLLTPGIFQGKASGDGFLGFMYLPGLLFHHSLDLRFTVPEQVPALGIEVTGRSANPCPIGPAFIWAPTYLLGLLLQKLHIVPTASAQRFGQNPADYLFAGLGALLFGQIGIAAMFRVLRRWLGVSAARFGTVTAVLATPLCFYLITQPLYQHACAFAAVALFLELWDAYDSSAAPVPKRQEILLGALAGVCMLMRLQEAIVLLLPGSTLLRRLVSAVRAGDRQALGGTLLAGVLVLGTAAAVFLPQVGVWFYFYGSLRLPQLPGHMRWWEPGLVETLFSLRAGLFPWVPALYLALPGLLLPPLRQRGLGLRLLLLFLCGFFVNAAAWDFHGSWAFGPRRFTDATPIFAAGLASTFAYLGQRRRLGSYVLIACAVVLVAYNGLLMELVRLRRVKSSSSGAFPAAEWVRWAKGPAWLEHALTRFGYPFAQPASLIYALAYHIPPSAFEGIVGNYFLERDWRVRAFIVGPTGTSLRSPSPYVFPEPPGTDLTRLRVLIPLYTREPLHLQLRLLPGSTDTDASSRMTLTWNGTPLPLRRDGPYLSSLLYTAEVPAEIVHSRARLNEVTLAAPRELVLDHLELASYVPWWQGPTPKAPTRPARNFYPNRNLKVTR